VSTQVNQFTNAVTVNSIQNVTQLAFVAAQGPAGPPGANGPNTVTTATITNLTGLLYGNGSNVAQLGIGAGLAIVGGNLTATSTGSGSVTSVGLALPSSIFSVSGSPVTASGTLTGTLANQSANLIFAGPSSGSAGVPTFRALVAADIPALSYASTSTTNTFTAGPNTFQTGGSGNVGVTIQGASGQTANLFELWGVSASTNRRQGFVNSGWNGFTTDSTREGYVSLGAVGISSGAESQQTGLTVTAQSSGTPLITMGGNLVFPANGAERDINFVDQYSTTHTAIQYSTSNLIHYNPTESSAVWGKGAIAGGHTLYFYQSTSNEGLTIQGVDSGHTYFQVMQVAGSRMLAVTEIGVGIGGNNSTPAAPLHVSTGVGSSLGAIFQAAAAQTNDIVQARDYLANVLLGVNSGGALYLQGNGSYLKLPSMTAANLTSASTSGLGSIACVTDATSTTTGTTVVGGGSNKVYVRSNGTNWIIF